MRLILRIGTRPSRLALKQVEEVEALLGGAARLEAVPIATPGDIDKTTPLSEIEGSDFFTREIERALLDGRIDAAVHSAKDIEDKMPEGLAISAITAPVSSRECLVSRRALTLDELPAGSVIGTSSRKRKNAILKFRPDLEVKDIRGSIEERLRALDEGGFDAVIMAEAALIRLGLEDRITQLIPADVVPPHPLQGRLTVQILKKREDLAGIFRGIDER